LSASELIAGRAKPGRPASWPAIAALSLMTVYLIALLSAEDQTVIISLIAAGVVGPLAAGWLGLLQGVGRSFSEHEDRMGLFAVIAALAMAAWFHENHFALLLIITVLLTTVATFGLNIQFGYAGVLNFAGASFFGIGAYTSAVLNSTALPHLLVLLIGGLLAALVGSALLLPVLRMRGHYAALITIAFALLFKTFLEVNDVLGGP